MRNLLFAVSLLFFSLFSVQCAVDSEKNSGDLFVEDADFDCGTITDTSTIINHTFVLKNNSRKTCVINQIQKSCGCTEVNCSKTRLLSGESAVVSVTLNIRGLYGEFRKGILIYTSLKESPLELSVGGFRLMPPEMRDKQFAYKFSDNLRLTSGKMILGYLQHGQSKSSSISVVNTSNNGVKLRGRLLPERDFVSLYVPEYLEPNEISRIIVAYDVEDINDVWGNQSCKILLSDGLRQDTIDVYCVITEKILRQKGGSPRILTLMKSKRQDTNGKLVAVYEVKNVGEKVLCIKDVQRHEGVDASFGKERIMPNESRDLAITVDVEAFSAKSYVDIWISSDDPIEPYKTLRIPI